MFSVCAGRAFYSESPQHTDRAVTNTSRFCINDGVPGGPALDHMKDQVGKEKLKRTAGRSNVHKSKSDLSMIVTLHFFIFH